jgi:hypothetical protein
MAEEKKTDGTCRRQFLRHGLTGTATVLAGLAVRGARAQDFPKASQEAAGYHDNATSQTCGECTLFIAPSDCKVVQGPISEFGTCIYFSQ